MKRQVYNPFLPLNEYIPDGEPHVFGDRIYLFGSHDKEGGIEYCELDYAAYSAPVNDLKDWRYEGMIYTSKKDPDYSPTQKYMYAPDVVQGNDGRYYLYYTLQREGGFNHAFSVAVCDFPAGEYEFYGHVKNPDGTPFLRFITHDPSIINDEGIIRLYYGYSLSSVAAAAHLGDTANIPEKYKQFQQANPKEALIQAQMMMFRKNREEIENEPEGIMGANTVILADDMLTVAGEQKRIVPGEYASADTGFEGHAFYEASSIRKIGDTYYFIYSSMQSNELCYATSKHPDRDFVYGGIIISNGDVGYQGKKPEDRINMTGNNHGSIECINGKWYIFYHRHTHNSTYSRQACAEPIVILPEGKIPQVECTSCGLNGGPLVTAGEYPAAIACNITNGCMPHITNRIGNADIPFVTHKDDLRFITNIKEGTLIGFKYFSFEGPVTLIIKFRGEGSGCFSVVCGDTRELPVKPASDWIESSIVIEGIGIMPLFLTYHGEGAVDLFSIRFEKINNGGN